MHENVAKNTYCPKFNRGIFENERKLKGLGLIKCKYL